MKKKTIALLLGIAMLFAAFAPGVFAEGTGTDTSTSTPAPTTEMADTQKTEAPANQTTPPETTEPAEPTTAPTATPTETPAVCTCEGTEEEKAAEGFVHKKGCPLYVAPTFDVEEAYAAVMATQSMEELEAYAATLSEEQLQVVAARVTEEDAMVLANRFGINFEETVITPAKNYTQVGPLLPPVQVKPDFRMFRSAKEAETDNGLYLSKKAVENTGDGTYTITMEAYTTGTVTSSEQSIPTDIVLVLDESGSMKDSMYSYEKVYTPLDESKTYYVKSGDSYTGVRWCGSGSCNGWYTGFHINIFIINFHLFGNQYIPMFSATDSTAGHVQFYTRSATQQTKNEALEAAAEAFVGKVYQDAVANEVDHRVSVIGFSGDGNASTKVGLVADIRDNYDNVNTAIYGLGTDGGTYIEDGMALAENAFATAAATAATKRNRIVIVFTDGIPGTGTWNNSMASANSAIATSKALKSTGTGGYGATVYTIGLLDGADPALEIIQENADGGTEDIARTNRFLHYLSSNYPDAESMTQGGTGSNQGYYLSASDTSSLEAIFSKIAEEIQTPTIDLGSDTVVKDIISPYFTAPANTTDIKLYTEDYTGTAFDGTRDTFSGATVNIQGDTVSVTGFDFTKNFISSTAKSDGSFGKKLIIEFTVGVRPGFLGGNNVPTNGDQSGVYKPGETAPVGSFDVPQVNVPIKEITVTAEDKNVYLMHTMTDEECKAGATATCNGVNLLNEADYTGENAWKASFVTVTTAITKPEQALTADGSYTLSVTVAPKNTDGTGSSGTAAETKTGTATKNINVFKPELTFKDSTVYYGDTAPQDYNNNYVADSTVWKHNETLSTVEAMIGTAPTLNLTYTPEAGKIVDNKINTKQDIGVKATVKIGETDVTTHTSFKHTACTGQTCTVPEGYHFLLHVKTCTLEIKKSGGEAGEPYVFTVMKDGDKYTEVTIVGNSSETICELPVGTYTIAEDTGWSWRYSAEYSNGVTLDSTTANGTLNCTNSRRVTQWLNGFSSVVKNIFGVPKDATPAN